jgi:host factor-I protein
MNMAKAPFNIQDQYLNQSRKERIKVIVHMMSGDKMEGHIKSFDNFSVLLDSNGDILIYKHAISTITSADGTFRLQPYKIPADRRGGARLDCC